MRRFLIFLLICASGYAQTIPPGAGLYSLSSTGGTSSGGASSALFSSTASGTVANSVAETTVIGTGSGSKTTTANYFTAGSVFVVEATGFYSSQAVDTLTVKIKGGATVALSTGAVAYGALTNKTFTVRALITCRTTGVSGAFIANTIFFTGGAALVSQDAQMLNTTTFTLDTTGTIAWDLTAQWSAASASDTITCTNFAMYTVGSSTGGSGTPAGTTGDIQINSSGSFGALTPATGISTFLAAPTSANLLAAMTTKTGTGNNVFATSPTFVTPILGTVAAGSILTNATGLPLSTGVTGNLPVANLNSGTSASSSTFWRGDGTWASPAGSGTVTVVAAGTLTSTALVTGGGAQALQTPSATATMDSSGNISTPGTLTAGNAATTAGALVLTQGTTQSTGTTNITRQAPTSVTSYVITEAGTVGSNNAFITQTTSGSTATMLNTKAVPTGTVLGTTDTQTLTNKWVQARITTIVSNATPTVNTDSADCVTITALAAAITSMTTNLSGTPVNFDQLEYRIKDDGTPRAITWGASFVAGPTALPTTTVTSKALHVYFEWDSVQTKWVCISSGSDA